MNWWVNSCLSTSYCFVLDNDSLSFSRFLSNRWILILLFLKRPMSSIKWTRVVMSSFTQRLCFRAMSSWCRFLMHWASCNTGKHRIILDYSITPLLLLLLSLHIIIGIICMWTPIVYLIKWSNQILSSIPILLFSW